MDPNKQVHKNLGLQLFSLLLAVSIWGYMHYNLQKKSGGPVIYKAVKAVEIKLMGEPVVLGRNIVSVEMETKSLDLRIKGPERLIAKLNKNDVVAFVDISGLQPGRTYSPVVNLILPPDVELVGAPPLARVEIKTKNF